MIPMNVVPWLAVAVLALGSLILALLWRDRDRAAHNYYDRCENLAARSFEQYAMIRQLQAENAELKKRAGV